MPPALSPSQAGTFNDGVRLSSPPAFASDDDGELEGELQQHEREGSSHGTSLTS